MSGEFALSILRRLVESQPGDTLSPAAAEAVLHLQLAESDQARMSELAAKSDEGTLTPAEADEYDAYIAAADWLSLWKSKARLAIKHHTTAA
ncbi:MAG TPA: hypothetical protein VGI81_06035 [Tepidisphaeraceae bacterium]|jgi:hypothetical protein